MANSVNKCVMHTHTRAGMAAAALEDGLLQIHMYSTGFHGQLAYHEYEGPSLDLDERERLLADLGDCNAMILRNHGILTVGRTIPEAFIWLYRLERACQVQLDAMAAGRLHIIDPKVVEHSARETARFLESEAAVGELEFQALMRKLDRIDPSYRE
jgi:ribulose-5-phosphate 4-epimerase/fuculose-1-phosphate aldolase